MIVSHGGHSSHPCPGDPHHVPAGWRAKDGFICYLTRDYPFSEITGLRTSQIFGLKIINSVVFFLPSSPATHTENKMFCRMTRSYRNNLRSLNYTPCSLGL